MQTYDLQYRLKEAITEFNLKLNSGYKLKEDTTGMMLNYLKKSLAGYLCWGEIGRIKRKSIYIEIDKNRVKSLYLSPVFMNYETWDDTHITSKFRVKIDSINQTLRDLDMESLYRDDMMLGKFPVTTDKLIESIKSFNFKLQTNGTESTRSRQ